MSLLFVDGFDHYATADFTKKWLIADSVATIQTSAGRFGGGCLRATGTSVNRSVTKTFPPTATWIIGLAVKHGGNNGANPGQIITLLDAAVVQCDVRINVDGTLSVTRNGTALTNGTSVAALSVGTWYYVELKVTIANSISAGSCKVRLNGVDVITVATGQDTQNTANATANQIRIGQNVTNISQTWDHDDLYVCDGNGSVNNDFLGDVRVETLYPTGAGNSTGFTPSAGANWQCVDDTEINSDTDYAYAAASGTKDLYAFGNLTSAPTSIFGVQTCLGQRKDDAGAKLTVPVTRSAGTDYDGSNHAVLDSYIFDHQVRELDPATAAAWTEAGVNAAEFGIKVVA
jgi:hypothetical protein